VETTVVAAVGSPVKGVTEAQALPSAATLPRVSFAAGFASTGADPLIRAAMTEEAALRVLLRRWGFSIRDLGAGDPCGRVAVLGLRCEREQGKLSHVRYFDRPVLLRVKDAGGERRYVVLGALDETQGTFDLPDGSEAIPIAAFDAVWTGDYTVVWQPPPTGATKIGPGAAEESIRWLRRTLSQVPGSALTDNGSGRFDPALTAGLRQFQTSRGLEADGIAGPRTLVQLGNAVALPDIPHLMTPALAAAAAAQAAAGVAAHAVGPDVVAERSGKP
jgi:general secretion pathway protein A